MSHRSATVVLLADQRDGRHGHVGREHVLHIPGLAHGVRGAVRDEHSRRRPAVRGAGVAGVAAVAWPDGGRGTRGKMVRHSVRGRNAAAGRRRRCPRNAAAVHRVRECRRVEARDPVRRAVSVATDHRVPDTVVLLGGRAPRVPRALERRRYQRAAGRVPRARRPRVLRPVQRQLPHAHGPVVRRHGRLGGRRSRLPEGVSGQRCRFHCRRRRVLCIRVFRHDRRTAAALDAAQRGVSDGGQRSVYTSYPTYLPTYRPTYLSTYLPTCLLTYLPTDASRSSTSGRIGPGTAVFYLFFFEGFCPPFPHQPANRAGA